MVKASPMVTAKGTAVTRSMISSDGHDTAARKYLSITRVMDLPPLSAGASPAREAGKRINEAPWRVS